MSHMGVARDLRAGLLQKGTTSELMTPSVSKFKVEKRTLKIDLKVENEKLAPRYCGVTISGITVKPSPTWLQNRLKAIGLTPKNNLDDVTNYVLHELGQPLHAFDYDKLVAVSGSQEAAEITVRNAKDQEELLLLDGRKIKMRSGDIVIAAGGDGGVSIGLAGAMGGARRSGSPRTMRA